MTNLFELKITEPKDGRYHVCCLQDYETTMYDTLDEAIDRAIRYLDTFRELGEAEDHE